MIKLGLLELILPPYNSEHIKFDIQAFKKNGILADVAPTLLEIMNIEKPEEMTGKSLIK